MSLVRIPTPLRPYTEGRKEVEASGPTVMAVLEDLTVRYPSLRPHLFNGEGVLRPYVNVFVNDLDIRGLEGEATALAAAAAALQLAGRLERACVVAIFPDSGLKYLGQNFWSRA